MRRILSKLLFDPPEYIEDDHRLSKKSDFEFIKKLGDGSYSNVWRVKHKKSNKTFAIKQVQKSKVHSILSQFTREVEILYNISHPHIIKLFSHFEDDRFFYLIMELMEGGTLFHKLYRDKRFSGSVAAQFFRELVLAIEYLHSFNPPIVHRDLKPENIMLDKDQRVKLIDFGSANYIEPDSVRKTYCGTAEYMSPEMLLKKGHGLGIDIWCLGVLLYEMLVGLPPFKSPDKGNLYKLIIEAQLKFPEKMQTGSKELISKMLEKDLHERLNISQVKNSEWLNSIPPIRKTIFQDLNSVKTHFDCKVNTQTTNSSDGDEDVECLMFGSKSSEAGKMNEALKIAKRENIELRKKMDKVQSCLNENVERMNELENFVFDKTREHNKICMIANYLHSGIFHSNIEIERLQVNEIDKKRIDQNNEEEIRLNSLEKECKIKKNFLENLRKNVNRDSVNLSNQEHYLQVLVNSLENLKANNLNTVSGRRSSEQELKQQIDDLRVKINKNQAPKGNFNNFELSSAHEIINTINAHMKNSCSIEGNIETYMIRVEEKISETEKMIEDLEFLYEIKKSNLLNKFSCKKSTFNHFQMRQEWGKVGTTLKQILQMEKKIFFYESRYPVVQSQDIQKANERILVIFI